jgi:hypothetical protein
MGFLLHSDRLRVMEKKLTNSGPLREPADKHSIYTLKLREEVERFFNNLKQFRRIATRYEKLSQTFLALIHLVAVWIIIK